MHLKHDNYKCPECGSHELELLDTGSGPFPANDAPITIELTSRTKCMDCKYEYQLLDFIAEK